MHRQIGIECSQFLGAVESRLIRPP